MLVQNSDTNIDNTNYIRVTASYTKEVLLALNEFDNFVGDINTCKPYILVSAESVDGILSTCTYSTAASAEEDTYSGF